MCFNLWAQQTAGTKTSSDKTNGSITEEFGAGNPMKIAMALGIGGDVGAYKIKLQMLD